MFLDRGLFRRLMARPEALPHREYRKELARYVSTMSEVEKRDILERGYEIQGAECEWMDKNYAILLRLGFTEREAEMLKNKRLDSPGMRRVIRQRVGELIVIKTDMEYFDGRRAQKVRPRRA